MKLKPLIAVTLIIGPLAQSQAMAQDAAQATPEAASAAAPSAPASAPAGTSTSSTSKVVPNIVVRWDCGSCEQNPKVAPLIEKSYQDEARALGHSVSPTETAEVTIKEYRQRPPAARALFGVFAGKDKLATTLNFRGQQTTADDYSANAFHGMNSLCLSVARQTLTQVLTALK